MGAAKVITRELDLSSLVPSPEGVYKGMVIKAVKGRTNHPFLITSTTDLRDKFTPDNKIQADYDLSYLSAAGSLQTTNKIWMIRPKAVNSKFSAIRIKSVGSSTKFDHINITMIGIDPISFTTTMVAENTTMSSITITTTGKTIDDLVGREFYVNSMLNKIVSVDETASTAILSAPAIFNKTDEAVSTVKVYPTSSGIDDYSQTIEADDSFVLFAESEGVWSDKKLKITIDNALDPIKKDYIAGTFRLDVYYDNLAVPKETFIVSLDPSANSSGSSLYLETVLTRSKYLRAKVNPANSTTPPSRILLSEAVPLLGGAEGDAITASQLILAIRTIDNKLSYPLKVLLDSGFTLSTYAKELYRLAQERNDCLAITSVPIEHELSADAINSIRTYVNETLNADTSFGAIYTPHVLVTDIDNDRQVYLAPSYAVGNAIATTIGTREPWFAPAGPRRGNIVCDDLANRWSSGEMDALDDMGVNPIKYEEGKGVKIWGQSTLYRLPSALQDINVRMLLITIEPNIAAALEAFLFENNDTGTRMIATLMLESFMDNIKARGGVYDYKVVCNETNNTPEDLDQKRLNVDLYVKPIKSIKFIKFTTVITRTGIDFNAII